MIGREKSRHCQIWLERRSSLNENLKRKQNWSAKSTNLEENAGIIKSAFVIGAALWAEKLERCLENYRSWKNTLGKLVVAVNLEAIWFEFRMKGALVTVEIFVFCGWWCSNQFDIMSETSFSCDTVGRELWLAILTSLLCPETDWNTRIGHLRSFTLQISEFRTIFLQWTRLATIARYSTLGKDILRVKTS